MLGLRVPCPEAAGVTVKVGSAVKEALTVQLATTGSVVKTVPTKLPPQVPPMTAVYPSSATTVKLACAPAASASAVAGVMDP